MDIKLDYYKIFYEVAKTESVTKASENLYISQPAISQTIKKLEEELGVVLFLRFKKGVTLTKIGRDIFNKVETALSQFSSVERLVQEENELLTGSLKIGCGSNIARKLLPKTIAEFSRLYPKVTLSQFENVQTKMFDMIRKGTCDVAITQENNSVFDLDFYPLTKERYIFIKKKSEEVKRFIKISDGSFAQNLFNEFTDSQGLKDFPTIKVSGYLMAIELTLRGGSATLVPEYLVSDLLKREEIEIIFENYKLPSVVFGCYYKKELLSPSANKFLEMLKKEIN